MFIISYTFIHNEIEILGFFLAGKLYRIFFFKYNELFKLRIHLKHFQV